MRESEMPLDQPLSCGRATEMQNEHVSRIGRKEASLPINARSTFIPLPAPHPVRKSERDYFHTA